MQTVLASMLNALLHLPQRDLCGSIVDIFVWLAQVERFTYSSEEVIVLLWNTNFTFAPSIEDIVWIERSAAFAVR